MCPLEGEKVLELISLLSVFGRCKATLRPLIRRKSVSFHISSRVHYFYFMEYDYPIDNNFPVLLN